MVAMKFWRGIKLNDNTIRLHGTGLSIDGDGVLFRGPSGAGKSDLALRMIDSGAAVLVSDDQTDVFRRNGGLFMKAPASIEGLLEIRAVGIVPVDTASNAPLRLIVDLVRPEQLDRLPEPKTETILDYAVPVVALTPFEASAPAKVRAALRHLTDISRAEAAE